MPEIKLIYQQIKDFIENEAKGKNPGDYLSSEVQYSKLFNISRPTVRKAVNELIDSGVVNRVPGKGIRVAGYEKDDKKRNLLIVIDYMPEDGFFYKTVVGCIDAANSLGYTYKICTFASPVERLEFVKNTPLSEYTSAVLTLYENNFDYEVLNLLERYNVPFVLVDNIIGEDIYPHVVTDDFKGGYLQGEHLVNKGHEKILYIAQSANNYTVRTRLSGFKKALSDHGIEIPDNYILYIKDDNDIKSILPDLKLEYTAVCGYSDLPIIIAFNTLSNMGISIPSEVSLLGYGDFHYSEILKVPLTTISMPLYEMGYTAVNMAVSKLSNKNIRESKILDVKIINRNSVSDLTSHKGRV